MRKEVIISILIGLSFGLIITYGVYKAKTAEQTTTQDITADSSLAPTTSEINPHKLVIHTPEDEIIQEENKTPVAGTTLANNFVVVLVGNDETITTADESGNFSVEVDLEDGANVITVYVLDEDGLTSSSQRTVIVSNEALDGNDTSSDSTKEASESAEIDEEEK